MVWQRPRRRQRRVQCKLLLKPLINYAGTLYFTLLHCLSALFTPPNLSLSLLTISLQLFPTLSLSLSTFLAVTVAVIVIVIVIAGTIKPRNDWVHGGDG